MADRQLRALRELAHTLGVAVEYRDGLGRQVTVAPDTLVAVCAALGAEIARPADAAEALRARRRAVEPVSPVVVAWDGRLTAPPDPVATSGAVLTLEDGSELPCAWSDGGLAVDAILPFGYHRADVEIGGHHRRSTVVSAPVRSWSRPGHEPRWGVAAHLAALRSSRSRALGDLADLKPVAAWLGPLGGHVLSVLPLLPTFNDAPPEPSPYSPVSRLFWSELILDLGPAHRPTPASASLDVGQAAAEVWAVLADRPLDEGVPVDAELARYARFRGAQARLGRGWMGWPEPQRSGRLDPADVDAAVERFHLVAQIEARRQLADLGAHFDRSGVGLGLDLAVGVHPDGYDPWSRPELFAPGVSVGAPPDAGFPDGQDWGFPPVLPAASRAEGHRYLAATVAHQAAAADVLRIDHIMAMSRLYWIPHGADRADGTYVGYPAEELFAVLALESHRNRCELVGENLGTVPEQIDSAMARHEIPGTFLAQFEAAETTTPRPPSRHQVAMIGTHDTPTFAGWLAGSDIDERVSTGLLRAENGPPARAARADAVAALAAAVGADPADPSAFLDLVLVWLAGSESRLVVVWIEDLWLEPRAVNLPGTASAQRANWQRPMAKLLDEVVDDEEVMSRLELIDAARRRNG